MKTQNKQTHLSAPLAAVVLAIATLSAIAADDAKIESNPDSVSVKVKTYAVNDSTLGKIEFRTDWGAQSPLLKDYRSLKGFVAVIVEWDVKPGQNIAPKGVRPHLRGVSTVPSAFEKSLADGKYQAVGINLEWVKFFMMQNRFTGEFAGVTVAAETTARFVWFVPKDTKSVEIILAEHKPLTLALPASK
jgi:hypothetical protein